MKKYCFAYAVILAFVYVIGTPIYKYGNFWGVFTPAYNLFVTMLSVIGLTCLFYGLSILVLVGLKKLEPHLESSLFSVFRPPVLLGVLIFCSWLPCYLAYYPGILSYDMNVQTAEALGNISWTRHHPPLHTFFWKLCLYVEKISELHALELYSVVQMLILAIALTYILSFLIRKKINNWIILFSFLFFCLTPMIAIVSFIPIKDVMLAAFFSVFTIKLYYLVSGEERENNIVSYISFCMLGVTCCLLRNNFFYALLPTLLVLVLVVRNNWKIILICGSSIIVCYMFINGPIYTWLGIGEGNVREMLSIPMQQMSYVVYSYQDDMDENDLRDVDQYFPVEEISYLYNPRLVDPIKAVFNTETFQKDPKRFFSVWFRLLKKYPDEYIASFLNLHIPYWYPRADAVDQHAQRHYIETTIYSEELAGYEVVRESKLPELLEWYERIASFEKLESNFILKRVFSLSTPFWVLFSTMLVVLSRKKKTLISIVLPAFFLWCTFILGPVSNFRYMIPIIVQYPLYLAVVLQPCKVEER